MMSDMDQYTNASFDQMEVDEENDDYHLIILRTWKFIAAIIMCICCFTGLCGNTISTFIFLHPSMRSSPINFLLAAVSLIDLLVLALIMPMLILPGMNFYFQSHQIYRFYLNVILSAYPIALMSQTASTWTYVLVVVERYVAVVQPLKTYKLLTMSQAKKTQSIIILASFFYNIIRFWEYRRSDDGHVEEYLRANQFYFLFYYASLHLVTHFLIPLSMIIGLNARIVRTLTNLRNRRLPLRRASNAVLRRQNRTAWMVVVATGAFVLTNTLTFFVNIWEAFEPNVMINGGPYAIPIHAISDLANILLISHSACSFLIYMIFCRQYRCLFRRSMIYIKLKTIRIFYGRSAENTMIDWQRFGLITDARYSPTDDGDGRLTVYRTRTLSTLASSIRRCSFRSYQ